METQFEQLVAQHGARIRRIARRYAAPGAVADLLQDTAGSTGDGD